VRSFSSSFCTAINHDWVNHLKEMINKGKSRGQRLSPGQGSNPGPPSYKPVVIAMSYNYPCRGILYLHGSLWTALGTSPIFLSANLNIQLLEAYFFQIISINFSFLRLVLWRKRNCKSLLKKADIGLILNSINSLKGAMKIYQTLICWIDFLPKILFIKWHLCFLNLC